MQKIRFSIDIDAPREKVWSTAFDDASYREWTKAFNESGSWYEGDWNEGSKIRFVGADENGKLGGMVSRIAASRRPEFVSVEHLGIIKDGIEDTTSPEATKWAPAFENYTFIDRGGRTEVLVEMDIEDEHKEVFEGMWPRALQRLKQLAEA